MADVAAEVALEGLTQSLEGISWLRFVLSPFFIVILIYIFISAPLMIVGIVSLFHRVRNWNRTRLGWIIIRKRMSNFHWLIFWSRPTGRKLKIKGEEGIELEIPFNIEVDKKDKDGKVIYGSDKKPEKIPMMGLEKKTDIAPNDKKDPAKLPILGGRI